MSYITPKQFTVHPTMSVFLRNQNGMFQILNLRCVIKIYVVPFQPELFSDLTVLLWILEKCLSGSSAG